MTTQQLIDQGRMQADSALALQDEADEQTFGDLQVAYRSSLPFITPAMQAFAAHWALNRNQVKAFQHAYPGSSVNAARTHARRLFADGRVQSEIRRVVESWSEKSGITLAQLEHELTRLGRSDVRNLFDEHGNIRPPHEWDADTAAAVASYTVVETTKGRGADKYTEVTRKVRLAEKHGPLRTLLEAKGAFEKHKAPPGAAAIFNINLGGQPLQLGAPVIDGRTINMDATGGRKIGALREKPKKPANARQMPRQVPKPAKPASKERSQAHRSKPGRAGRHVEAPECALEAPGSVEISTVDARIGQTDEISTHTAKPPLF